VKILLTGVNGQVGSALKPLLMSLGTVQSPPREELDLADAPAVAAWVRRHRPHLIVNAAAYTAVDRAEQEQEAAFALNARLPEQLGRLQREWGGAMIHYSTDYVFDGTRDGAYTEGDETAPLGVYGRSKRAGEEGLMSSGAPSLIFRTSWVYGLHGRNFLRTMLRLGQERAKIQVVNDQWGAPTWAGSIAQGTMAVCAALCRSAQTGESLVEGVSGKEGIYHLTNGGATTWYDFTRRIFELRPECRALVLPIPSSDYPSPVRRPANSRLDNTKLKEVFGIQLSHWSVALEDCLAELPAVHEVFTKTDEV
jgi:dTDP-4-dehydrorhamnose reductase